MKRLLFVVNSLEQKFILNKIELLSERGYACSIIRENNNDPHNFLRKKFHIINSVKKKISFKNFLIIFFLLINNPILFIHNFILAKRKSKNLADAFFITVKVLPILSIKPDIIHFEFAGIALNYSKCFFLLKRSKIFMSCRGTDVQIKPIIIKGRKEKLNELFKKIDRVHCVSNYVKNICNLYGLNKEKAFINYPSVDTKYFKSISKELDNNNIRISIIGRLHWVKGIEFALIALSLCNNIKKISKINIVGNGPEEEKIKFFSNDLGLDSLVSIHGFKDSHHIKNIYEQTDIVLLPSIMEGISNSAIEAMAMEKILISSNTCGMPELINDKINGILFEKYNYIDLAEKLDFVISNILDFDAIRKKARERVVANFNIHHQIDIFEKEYLK